MKKEYIKPELEVFELRGRDAILAAVSANPGGAFDTSNDAEGDNGDYSRENNRPSNPNLWDNVW